MSRKNSDTNGANPMLYDPLQEGGIGETSKIRQFMAATVGKRRRKVLCLRVLMKYVLLLVPFQWPWRL